MQSEGAGRSLDRAYGNHSRDTIMRLGVKVGKGCGIFYSARTAARRDAISRFVTKNFFAGRAALPLEFHGAAAA
jgi:hypothetical protein